MSKTNELNAVRDELLRRGVVDVKFCWAPDTHTRTYNEVAGDVVTFLKAYLNGHFVVVKTYKPEAV